MDTRSRRRQKNPEEPSSSNDPPEEEEEEIIDDLKEDLLALSVPPRPVIQETSSNNRLVISKIIMYNFKSYHGKKVVGDFHKNVSVIMGPNGSGKSNVIDSLLFVFGHRSNRIRCKRLSSLIHSSSLRTCNSCRVEIFFVRIKDIDKDNFVEIPNTEFVVAREAYRNDTSRYYLDEKLTSFREIEKKLQYDGIDLQHNRFLILQGEVEAISMLPPKAETPGGDGILEYLDDIIGTSRYKELIDRMEKRVDLLQKQLTVQEQKKKKLLAEKKLQVPRVKKYMQYLNTINEEVALKAKLLQCEIETEKKKEADLLLESQANLDNIAVNELRIKTVNQEIGELDQKEENLENERTEKLAVRDHLELEIENLQRQERRMRTECLAAEKALVDLKNEETELGDRALKIQEAIDEGNKVILMQEPAQAQLAEDEEEALATADRNWKKFEIKSAPLKIKQDEAEKEYAKKSAVLNSIKAEIEAMACRAEGMNYPVDMAKASFNRAKEALDHTSARVKNLHGEFVSLNNELPACEVKNEELAAESNRLTVELENIWTKIDLAKKRLETEEIMSRNFVEGSKVHRELMQAKHKRELRGLVGRLGDLGTIDKKYDTALSTMCNQLDFYVVLNKDSAEECIVFLKQNHLPRTSFYCLDQISKTLDDQMLPRNFPAPRLFDQIKTDKIKIRRIFYQTMGDMLVADNLAEAKKLYLQCNGRYRIVTLNGETIDRSGAMSGGGIPKTGRMGEELKTTASYEDEQKLMALEEQLEIDREQYESLRKEKDVVDMHLAENQVELKEMKAKQDRVVSEIANLEDIQRQQTEFVEKKQQQLNQLKKKKNTAVEAALMTEIAEWRQKEVVADHDLQKCLTNLDTIKEKIGTIYNELVEKYRIIASNARQCRLNTIDQIAKARARISKHAAEQAKNEDRLRGIPCERNQLELKLQALVREYRELLGLEVLIDDELVIPAATLDVSRVEKKIEDIDKSIRAFDVHYHDIRQQRNEKMSKRIDFMTKLRELEPLSLQAKRKAESARHRWLAMEQDLSEMRLEQLPCSQWHFQDPIDTVFPWMYDPKNAEEVSFPTEITPKHQPEVEETSPIPSLMSREELDSITDSEVEAMKAKLKTTQQWLDKSRESIEPHLVQFFIRLNNRVWECHEEQQRLLTTYLKHRNRLYELTQQRLNEFMEGFLYIRSCVFDLVHLITDGGCAILRIVDGEGNSPYEKGIRLLARPVKKAWKEIENLSGGEKTLVSLCFVFSLHRYRPTPFYVMDEIDAALDIRNVGKLAQYISMAPSAAVAQYIIISLRLQMMESADRLIGVYKVNDMSNNVIMDMKDLRQALSATNAKLNERLKKSGEQLPESESTIDDEPKHRIQKARALKRKADEMAEKMATVAIREVREPSTSVTSLKEFTRSMYAHDDSDEEPLQIDEEAEPNKLESYMDRMAMEKKRLHMMDLARVIDEEYRQRPGQQEMVENNRILMKLDPNVGIDDDWIFDEDPVISDDDEEEARNEMRKKEERENTKGISAEMIQKMLQMQKEAQPTTSRERATEDPEPKKAKMATRSRATVAKVTPTPTKTGRPRRRSHKANRAALPPQKGRSRSPIVEDIFRPEYLFREDTPEKEKGEKEVSPPSGRRQSLRGNRRQRIQKPSTSRKPVSSSSEDEDEDPDDDLAKFEAQLR